MSSLMSSHSTPFRTKWPNKCQLCNEKIGKGDMACYIQPGNLMVHVNCAENQTEEEHPSMKSDEVQESKVSKVVTKNKEPSHWDEFWGPMGESVRDEARADLKAGHITMANIPSPHVMPYLCELRPYACKNCTIDKDMLSGCYSRRQEVTVC